MVSTERLKRKIRAKTLNKSHAQHGASVQQDMRPKEKGEAAKGRGKQLDNALPAGQRLQEYCSTKVKTDIF
jgi:hypothetical protein